MKKQFHSLLIFALLAFVASASYAPMKAYAEESSQDEQGASTSAAAVAHDGADHSSQSASNDAVKASSVPEATPMAHSHTTEPLRTPAGGWPHAGLTGTFDRAALQRGFHVYRQVCSTCHSLDLVSWRHLKDIGFNDEEVKALAAATRVKDGPNDEGEMYERTGRPSDKLPAPFANDKLARVANNGALPPDLSLIVKARPGHEDYIYSLLSGYRDPPAGHVLPAGMYYNPWFPHGGQIAMSPPLSEGILTYADGTPATVEQMAKDVTQFLTWTAEPKLEARKQTGIKVVVFLAAMAAVLYGLKLRVWAKINQ